MRDQVPLCIKAVNSSFIAWHYLGCLVALEKEVGSEKEESAVESSTLGIDLKDTSQDQEKASLVEKY